MPRAALSWRWQGVAEHSDGALLLALARRLGEPAPHDRRRPFLLLAHGAYCLPALDEVRADADCRGALLLQPVGDERGVKPLPFPALVVCHRPDVRAARLTQAASLAAAWQARLYLLQEQDTLRELTPLLAALQHLVALPPLGEL